MIVADVMMTQLVTVTPETSVQEIAGLFYNRNISGVPVVDKLETLVGIVTEGDLMGHVVRAGEQSRPRSWLAAITGAEALAHEYAKSHGHTAADVMTRQVHTTSETADLGSVVKLMERHGVKRVPVLSEGRLVGIVTRRDLLRVLATNVPLKSAGADDRTIRDNLLAELSRNSWAAAGAKNIIVKDGVVHLFGFVENDSERQAMIAAARDIPGVNDVEDHLAPAIHIPI